MLLEMKEYYNYILVDNIIYDNDYNIFQTRDNKENDVDDDSHSSGGGYTSVSHLLWPF